MTLSKKRVFELMMLSAMMESMSEDSQYMIHQTPYAFGGRSFFGGSAIYIPKRTKYKGWMKENRRSTFNKNK